MHLSSSAECPVLYDSFLQWAGRGIRQQRRTMLKSLLPCDPVFDGTCSTRWTPQWSADPSSFVIPHLFMRIRNCLERNHFTANMSHVAFHARFPKPYLLTPATRGRWFTGTSTT